MYKLVDLFAGAGGLSLGFQMTKKFEIVAYVENNENAAKTYKINHPETIRFTDIKAIDFKEVLEATGDVDIIVGGPPCQGFSNANRQKRKIINGNNELVKRYVEAIKILKPKVFVMENVKTIASNKHSFYLTKFDKEYISNDLEVKIYEKDSILYDRKVYVDKLLEFIKSKENIERNSLEFSQVYFLDTLLKRKSTLNEFLNKSANHKKLYDIIMNLNDNTDESTWFAELKGRISKILNAIIETKSLVETDAETIRVFIDIQNLFQGIGELETQSVIYNLVYEDEQIIARMETYVVIDYINASFEKMGYQIKGAILNAANYGVPQKRERFILIGVNSSLYKNEIVMPQPIITEEKDFLTVGEAIQDLEKYNPSVGSMDDTIEIKQSPVNDNLYKQLVLDSDIVYNHVCTASTSKAKERFKNISQGNNFHSLPEELKDTYESPNRTQNTIYKRLVSTLPSDTVVNVRKSMWIHPNKDRAISAREAARLQSFPDSYRFIGTKDSVYQQIGNAVPPMLGKAIADIILEVLSEIESDNI